MTIRHLDHAIRIVTPIGTLRMQPGLVDVDRHPQVIPHLEAGTAWANHSFLYARLRRCCPACESAYETT